MKRNPFGPAATLLVLGWSLLAARPDPLSEQTRQDYKGFDSSLVRVEEAKRLVAQGLVFFQDQELDHARALFEKALTLDKSCIEARYRLGCLEREAGRFHLAVDHLEQVYTVTPARDSLCFLLAESYLKLGECETAGVWLDRQNKRDNSIPAAAALKRKISDCKKRNSVDHGRKK
ncbi:tetratricopeptide repeat protein [bacterium]|nr:tetratricopeptide repeat protein [bacterium]